MVQFFGNDVIKECEQSLKLTQTTHKSWKQLSDYYIALSLKKELAFCNIVPEAKGIYCEQNDFSKSGKDKITCQSNVVTAIKEGSTLVLQFRSHYCVMSIIE